MIVDLDWAVALGCVLIVYVGATVQASIGIGLGMIAAPLLALADGDFIPAPLVMMVLPLSLSIAWIERRHVERRGVGIALVGRLPGAIAGALVAAALSDDLLRLLVAVSVLGAVAASLSTRRFRPSDGGLAVAGLASGFAGTSTGVGGPPMALTYQHADPIVMRASLAAFFAAGSIMSLAALSAAGQISATQWQLGALLLPGVVAGLATARIVADRLDPRVVRPTVLVICTASSIALLARVVF